MKTAAKTAETPVLEEVTDRILSLAKKAGATSAEAMAVSSVNLMAACRLGQQEQLERSASEAVGLRVWAGDRLAIVSTSNFADASLKTLVERAVAMAKVATPDPFATLADSKLLAKKFPELDLYDAKEPMALALLDMALAAEDAGRGIQGITNSEGAEASYSASHIFFRTSNGFEGGYEVSTHSLVATLLAGEKDGMERDYDYTVARHAEDLQSPLVIGRKAAENTLARLNSRKVNSATVPVVFDPRVGRGMLSTFAGAISGSSVARKTTFLLEQMGQPIFSKQVSIVDDPYMVRGLGSHPFDDEGVAGKKKEFVKNGVLQSWLLDTRSANQLGLKTTGHGSRGLSSPPSPSPTNLYMEKGKISREKLLKQVKNGLYVTDVFGMGVNIITGDYSQGATGFWIENGELAYPVSEITIAGKLQEMLKNLTPADDLEFRYSSNTPTFVIEGMTLAGN